MHHLLRLAPLAVALCICASLASVAAQPRPGCVCTAVFDPVCGSDGIDYSSPCQADCAGVTVAYPGICRDIADTGGSSSSSSSPGIDDGTNTPRSTIQLPGGININLPMVNRQPADGTDCLCSDIDNPVCGEDGQTYTNDCQASCAGVLVASDGPCEISITPSPAAAAPPRLPAAVTQEDGPAAAASPPAAAEGTTSGIKPDCVCSDVSRPVCGANQQTYGNACEADCAGVDVVAEGPCIVTSTPPIQSPSPSPAAAAAASSPAAVDSSPAAAAASPALDKPEGCVCTALYDPVCGTDGKDYPSACEADCAGVQVANRGVCTTSSPAAATPTPAATPSPAAVVAPSPPATPAEEEEEVPAPATAVNGDASTDKETDAAPVPKPEGCACPMMYAPVCTDKGVTRSNACVARCQGEKVVNEGSCKNTTQDQEPTQTPTAPAPAPAASPVAAAAVPAEEPVAAAAAAAAGRASGDVGSKDTGACGSCGDTYSPVCGTDRVTYSNRCEAECLNGATVAFEGVCASRDFTDNTAASTATNVTVSATRSSALSLHGGSSSSSIAGLFGSLVLAVAALMAMLVL